MQLQDTTTAKVRKFKIYLHTNLQFCIFECKIKVYSDFVCLKALLNIGSFPWKKWVKFPKWNDRIVLPLLCCAFMAMCSEGDIWSSVFSLRFPPKD